MGAARELRERFERSLLGLDRLGARAVVDECLASSASVSEMVDDLIVPVLDDLGDRWQRGDLSLSEVYMGARITEELIAPLFSAASIDDAETCTAVCVLEDYHALGKKMVLGSLRCSGIPVIDLGHGLHVDEVVDAVRRRGIRVLLVSVLMLRSALRVKDLMQRLADEGLDVKVAVGGAPFRLDPTLAEEVGADAWARSATEAPRLVQTLGGA